MIKYAIASAHKFGIRTTQSGIDTCNRSIKPKIHYMQDYLDIMDAWRKGEFGDVIMDGPLDIFSGAQQERGSIKNVRFACAGRCRRAYFP